MQLLDAGGDPHALCIHPRPRADAVPRVHRPVAACAKVGAPRAPTGPDRFGQRLAVCVRTFQPAKVRAIAQPRAGDEERHFGWGALLSLHSGSRTEAEQRGGNKQMHASVGPHAILPLMFRLARQRGGPCEAT